MLLTRNQKTRKQDSPLFLITPPQLIRQFLPFNQFLLSTNDIPPQRPSRGCAPATLPLGWPTCDVQVPCLCLRWRQDQAIPLPRFLRVSNIFPPTPPLTPK